MISKEIIYIGLVSAVRFNKQLSDLSSMHTRIVIDVETVTRKLCTGFKEQTTSTRSLEKSHFTSLMPTKRQQVAHILKDFQNMHFLKCANKSCMCFPEHKQILRYA